MIPHTGHVYCMYRIQDLLISRKFPPRWRDNRSSRLCSKICLRYRLSTTGLEHQRWRPHPPRKENVWMTLIWCFKDYKGYFLRNRVFKHNKLKFLMLNVCFKRLANDCRGNNVKVRKLNKRANFDQSAINVVSQSELEAKTCSGYQTCENARTCNNT